MFKCISASVRPFVIAGIFFIIGCQKSNDHVLVTIEGHEAITVNDLKIFVEKKYGENTAKLTFLDKRKYLDLIINDRLKLAYGIEKGFDKDVSWNEEKEIKNILYRNAYEKYIFGYFVTEDYVKAYMDYFGATIRVQNIVIRFKDRKGSLAKLTAVQAKRKADSIYVLINKNNFEELAEKHSDYYLNPYSKKVNIAHEKMQIGQIPVLYEREVIKMRPNSISKPIKIQGAYVICRFIAHDDSSKGTIDVAKAKALIKSRLQGDDYASLIQFQNVFMDSLYESADVKIINENMQLLLDKLLDTANARAKAFGLTEEDLDKPIAILGTQRVSLRDFIRDYSPNRIPSPNYQIMQQMVKDYCQSFLLADLSIRDGFMESEAFRAELTESKKQQVIKRVSDELAVTVSNSSESDLYTYYSRNRSKYRTDGAIVWSEIHSPTLEQISAVERVMQSGTDFAKIPDIINGKNNAKDVKYIPNNSSKYTEKNELVHVALRMNKNDVSRIISRKSGGFSVIKVENKIEPEFLKYETVKTIINTEYRNHGIGTREKKLLRNLKNRWKVVIYENNL
ncbi:peptidylprolyl isomerase [bacterium]|nr:peptidylprolyl isomerase [bacterium]